MLGLPLAREVGAMDGRRVVERGRCILDLGHGRVTISGVEWFSKFMNKEHKGGDSSKLALAIALGMAFGTSLGISMGVVFDQLAMGVALGPGIGLALGMAWWAMQGRGDDK